MLYEGPYNVYYWTDMYLNHPFFAWCVSTYNSITELPSLSESTSTIVSKAISSTSYFPLTKILLPKLPLKHSESLCFHYFLYFPSYLFSCCITNFSNSNLSWLKVVSLTQLRTAHVARHNLWSYKLSLVHSLNYGLELCKEIEVSVSFETKMTLCEQNSGLFMVKAGSVYRNHCKLKWRVSRISKSLKLILPFEMLYPEI